MPEVGFILIHSAIDQPMEKPKLLLKWFIFVIGLTGLLLPSCGVRPAPSPLPTISEEAARDRAVRIASTDDFHFTGATGPVSVVREDQMTMQSALQFMQEQQLACNYDSDKESITSRVWVVTMESVWPQNFPPVLTPTPTWAPWHTLVVVLDAATGGMVCMDANK